MAANVSNPPALEELRQMGRLRRLAPIHLRLRAVILTREGHQQKHIAAQLGRTPAWVLRWTRRFDQEGLEGLWDRRRSGQPTKLARAKEKAFRARVLAGPAAGDGVSVWRGRDLQRLLAREFGARYGLNGVYALLRRLKLSWLCARPRHPKSDPAAQERWKQKAPLLSKR